MKALDAFKKGGGRVQVAADVAARGLDISELPAVTSYDVPITPEDFMHRIGRTGRVGASGLAITIATGADGKSVAAIEQLIKRNITPEKVDLYAMPRPPRGERTARAANARAALRGALGAGCPDRRFLPQTLRAPIGRRSQDVVSERIGRRNARAQEDGRDRGVARWFKALG